MDIRSYVASYIALSPEVENTGTVTCRIALYSIKYPMQCGISTASRDMQKITKPFSSVFIASACACSKSKRTGANPKKSCYHVIF